MIKFLFRAAAAAATAALLSASLAAAAAAPAKNATAPAGLELPAKGIGLLSYLDQAKRINGNAYSTKSFDEFWGQYLYTLGELNRRNYPSLPKHAVTLNQAGYSLYNNDEADVPMALPNYDYLASLPKCTPIWRRYLNFLRNYAQYVGPNFLNMPFEQARKGLEEADALVRSEEEFSQHNNVVRVYRAMAEYYLMDVPSSQFTYRAKPDGTGNEVLKDTVRQSFEKFLAEDQNLIIYPAAKAFIDLVASENYIRTKRVKPPVDALDAALRPHLKLTPKAKKAGGKGKPAAKAAQKPAKKKAQAAKPAPKS